MKNEKSHAVKQNREKIMQNKYEHYELKNSPGMFGILSPIPMKVIIFPVKVNIVFHEGSFIFFSILSQLLEGFQIFP
jgi:hypothetical protein